IESGVVPVSLYQVRVYTVLDDASVLQYQYAISILHRGQAVRNDEGGSLRQQSVQRFLHSPLGSRIYAAKQLGVDDIFSSLSHGYNTVVGQGGVGLSAGERQLVAYARTFFSRPAILVLDEATSSVDPATERRMEKALDRLLAERTALIIAH